MYCTESHADYTIRHIYKLAKLPIRLVRDIVRPDSLTIEYGVIDESLSVDFIAVFRAVLYDN